MLETKPQKQYFWTAVALVIILSLVTFWHRPNFKYTDSTDYTKANKSTIDAQTYLKYLSDLKVDPKASKDLFNQLVTQEELATEVNQALQTDQSITLPKVDTSKFNISKAAGQQAVVDYLTATVGPVLSFNKNTSEFNKTLFSGDTNSVDAVLSAKQDLIGKLIKAEVPKETVPMQKALLSSFSSYDNLLKLSKDFAANPSSNPWPQVYQDYAAINQAAQVYNTEFSKLENKYKLSSLPPLHFADSENTSGLSFIPTAHAFLGLGDLTVTIGDIPSLIADAVKQGLASSFSQFMGVFIEKVITKIEQNYLISNFLYYSDALVSGQYTQDYLNKYVADNFDREIIKKFIPQFNCGSLNANLAPVFQAKAQSYLGFDPQSVSPDDPNYYQKMASVGNFLSSPTGWQIYYQDLAVETESQAQRSADRELTSSGLKSPRDTINNSISVSINSIVSSEKASLEAIMQLGIANADKFISAFVAQLTQNLVNNFVFRGAVNSKSVPGVFKEQPTCMAAAQIQVVLPASTTTYVPPPPPPSEGSLIQQFQQQCAQNPRGCSGTQLP